jgi:hypothetical protein
VVGFLLLHHLLRINTQDVTLLDLEAGLGNRR